MSEGIERYKDYFFDSYYEICKKLGKANVWRLSIDEVCEEIDKIVEEKFSK